MTKRVTIGNRPVARATDADAWVESRNTGEETKKLTFNVPASLHKRMKVSCAKRGVRMSDEIRELLEKHYPETP